MTTRTRTIKTVLVSMPSVGRYPRWQYRVVECYTDQSGHLTERNVRVLWSSQLLYRPITKTGRGQGPEVKAVAIRIAQEKLQQVLGI